MKAIGPARREQGPGVGTKPAQTSLPGLFGVSNAIRVRVCILCRAATRARRHMRPDSTPASTASWSSNSHSSGFDSLDERRCRAGTIAWDMHKVSAFSVARGTIGAGTAEIPQSLYTLLLSMSAVRVRCLQWWTLWGAPPQSPSLLHACHGGNICPSNYINVSFSALMPDLCS
jgi:hypothetical protein